MNLTDVKKARTPRKKKFPKGRGESSGVGKTAGRGRKGQWARTGTSFRPYFEGGQMSIIRRLPKRGFNNKEFRTEYEIVHLSDLAKLFDAKAGGTLEVLNPAPVTKPAPGPSKDSKGAPPKK